ICHQEVFRIPGWSRQIHSRLHEPAATRGHSHGSRHVFAYGILTLYDRPSQATSTNTTVFHSRSGRRTQDKNAPQPHTHNPRRLTPGMWFSHPPRSLATTNGI